MGGSVLVVSLMVAMDKRNHQKPIPDYLKPPKPPKGGGNFGRRWLMAAADVIC